MTKKDRVQAIIDAVMARDAKFSSIIPGNAPGECERLIHDGSSWRARVVPDARIGYMRRTQSQILERVVAQQGCTFFELRVFNELALQANIRGRDIQLHLFQPGEWESMFGVDYGCDTVPVLPLIFADPASAAWQAFTQSDDYRLPL